MRCPRYTIQFLNYGYSKYIAKTLGLLGLNIDYRKLREFNPGAARRAVLEYLKTDSNISEIARMFGITRAAVYDILKKEREGDLRDQSRAPKYQPQKTPAGVEDREGSKGKRTHNLKLGGTSCDS